MFFNSKIWKCFWFKRISFTIVFELKKQRKKLTITHKDATRFWITLDQGIQFVFDCLTIMKGGEIFILKFQQ